MQISWASGEGINVHRMGKSGWVFAVSTHSLIHSFSCPLANALRAYCVQALAPLGILTTPTPVAFDLVDPSVDSPPWVLLWTECLCPPEFIPQGDGIWRWAFGWHLGLDEVMRVGPCDGISVLVRRRREKRALPLHHVRTQQEGSCLWTKKRGVTRTESAGTLFLDVQPPDHET